MRIEICGGIAAGKTSLAHILQEEGYTAVFERFEDNPFLNAFYMDDDADNTFETETVFAILHSYWIRRRMKAERLVSDYSLFQDYCYGVSNLQAEDFAAFENLYHYLLAQLSGRGLLIYLKCHVECLLERIKQRGREAEMGISREYLQNNIRTMEEYLVREKNVLVIESDKYNFIEKDRDRVVRLINQAFKQLESNFQTYSGMKAGQDKK